MTAACAVSRKFGEGAVRISMTPKTCRHSAFKIKRFVPRNRWKFLRSSAATNSSSISFDYIIRIRSMKIHSNYYQIHIIFEVHSTFLIQQQRVKLEENVSQDEMRLPRGTFRNESTVL